jgi:hypothetical protein
MTGWAAEVDAASKQHHSQKLVRTMQILTFWRPDRGFVQKKGNQA